MRGYYKQLFVITSENLDEMDKFIEKLNSWIRKKSRVLDYY